MDPIAHIVFVLSEIAQNPPSVPALAVCHFYCNILHWLKRPKLVVDWHNYGYTILSMALGSGHFLVRMSKRIEAFFGPRASAAFCVSKAMKKNLEDGRGWIGLPEDSVTVLYDRPAPEFR